MSKVRLNSTTNRACLFIDGSPGQVEIVQCRNVDRNDDQTGILARQTGLAVVLNDQSGPKWEDKEKQTYSLAMRLNHHLKCMLINLFQ